MLRDRLQSVLDWLARVVTQPRSELTRWQRATRFAYDLGRYGARQLRQDNAPQMAGALSFRTLFGMLPVLVVATVLVRSGFIQMRDMLAGLFAKMNFDETSVTQERAGQEAQSLSDFLLGLFDQAQSFNAAAVGWIGFVILVYSAISLMATIEGGFNAIYRAPSGRSWLRRVPVYSFVLTWSPVLIGATAWMNNWFSQSVAELGGWQWLLVALPALWGFAVTWLLMFGVYMLVPNTAVAARPALIGALVATVLIEIGRRSLGAYLGNLMSIQLLYGSLGLIPLFMFWVYIMWLVVLFGLEVSATLQALGGRSLEEIERKTPTGLVDPAAMLALVEIVVERFRAGEAVTPRSLAEAAALPEPTVIYMVDALVAAAILHRVEGDSGAVVLALPPEKIEADRIVKLGFELVRSGDRGRVSTLVRQLHDAQSQVAGQMRLG